MVTFVLDLFDRRTNGVTTGVCTNIKRSSIELRSRSCNHICECFLETSESLFTFWRPLELHLRSLLSFYFADLE